MRDRKREREGEEAMIQRLGVGMGTPSSIKVVLPAAARSPFGIYVAMWQSLRQCDLPTSPERFLDRRDRGWLVIRGHRSGRRCGR